MIRRGVARNSVLLGVEAVPWLDAGRFKIKRTFILGRGKYILVAGLQLNLTETRWVYEAMFLEADTVAAVATAGLAGSSYFHNITPT